MGGSKMNIFDTIKQLKQSKEDIKTALKSQGAEDVEGKKLSELAVTIGSLNSSQKIKLDEIKSIVGSENYLNTIRDNHTVATKVENLGGLSERFIQSDKLGYNWRETYIGEKLITQEYVQQENPIGFADTPIEFVNGVQLIPNAYYLFNGVRYVYMGESGVYNSDSSLGINEKFVEF